MPVAKGINTYNEKALHAALKDWYAEPGDRFEVKVAGRLIDLVRGELLVEVQTCNFAALRRKFEQLLQEHDVRLVYPIAVEKYIVKVDGGQQVISRRRSPKRGRVQHIFSELVFLPRLMAHPRFSIEVLLIREEEVRCHQPGKAWRRKGWVTIERRLLDVVERCVFRDPEDFRRLLPEGLCTPFTTGHLADGLGTRRRVAQQMAYCLRKMGAIEAVGKTGNARLYRKCA